MPGLNEDVLGRLRIEARDSTNQQEIVALFDVLSVTESEIRSREQTLEPRLLRA